MITTYSRFVIIWYLAFSLFEIKGFIAVEKPVENVYNYSNMYFLIQFM